MRIILTTIAFIAYSIIAYAGPLEKADSLYKSGKFKAAMTEAQHALDKADIDGNRPESISALSLMGIIAFDSGDKDKAIEYCCKAFKLVRIDSDQTYKQTIFTICNTLLSIARIYRMNGDHDKALEYMDKCLEIERILERPRQMCLKYNEKIEILIECGKYAEALETIDESKLYSKSSAPYFNSRQEYQRGLCMEAMGDSTYAENRFREAASIARGLVGKEHVILPLFLNKLATYSIGRGEISEAIRYLQESDSIENMHRNNSDALETYTMLSEIYKETDSELSEHYATLAKGLDFQPFLNELAYKVAIYDIDFPTLARDQKIKNQRLKIYALVSTAILLLALLILALANFKVQRRLSESQKAEFVALEQTLRQKERLLEIANVIADEKVRKNVADLADEMGKEVKLSKREMQISELIADGLLNKEIADHLNISVRTVESHRNSIYRKLGINNSVELINWLRDRT